MNRLHGVRKRPLDRPSLCTSVRVLAPPPPTWLAPPACVDFIDLLWLPSSPHVKVWPITTTVVSPYLCRSLTLRPRTRHAGLRGAATAAQLA